MIINPLSYKDSKEELFKAIIEEWEKTLREMLLSPFEVEKLTDGLGDLIDRVLMDRKGNIGLSFEFISQASRDPSIGKILKEYHDKNMKVLTAFLEIKKGRSANRNKRYARSQASALIAFPLVFFVSLLLSLSHFSAHVSSKAFAPFQAWVLKL